MQKLSEYGYNFQAKLITILLTDQVFCSRVFDLLKSDYFDTDAMEWIYGVVSSYFEKYHSLATLEVMRAELESVSDTVLKQEVLRTLETAVGFSGSDDLEYIKTKVIDFCRKQELTYAITKSVDLLEKDDFEGVKLLIDSAVRKGLQPSSGIDYLTDIELRYTTGARTPIPTGFPIIDRLTGGGLSAGELGFVVGPGGHGKSWVLATISANALQLGYDVLYVSLELVESYVGIRLDSILTNYPTEVLGTMREEITRQLNTIEKGSLRIEWYPTKKLSLVGLRALIDKRILLGTKPHLLVLDYADLMQLTRRNGLRKDEALQELCEELRGLAGEYGIPIWTASQANRDSHGQEVEYVDASKIAESMGKHYTADFMISLLRKKTDVAKNRARFHVIKNRFGADALDLLASMDTSRGILTIHDPDDPATKQMTQSIVEDTVDVQSKMAMLYKTSQSE